MPTPPPGTVFDASTSETGDGASILFSEQVRADTYDSAGPSTTSYHNHQNQRRGHAAEPEGDDGDNDTEPDAGSMFFYVVDDSVPTTAGIMPPGQGKEREDEAMDQDEHDPPPDVDMNFWLESGEEGDEDVEGGGETTPRATPAPEVAAAPTPPPPPPPILEVTVPTDNETSSVPRPVRDDRYCSAEVVESDDDVYVEPASYHSGDSDEYEMDHRPWLERTAIKRDIQELYAITGMQNSFLGTERYRAVDRLGEGTFSSVYLAHDTLHHLYDNRSWREEDELSLSANGKVKVALKKILVTSSPSRIENELSILENLRGCRNVSPLISAFRDEDQIVVVLPFHPSDDFRYFYRLMDPPKIKQYMTCLFRALKDTHSRGIIHRDVKPANFLFDYETGHGVLVDFGLAERYAPPRRPMCQHEIATPASPHGTRTKTSDTVAVEQAVYDARKRAKSGDGRVGFRQEDSRPAIKTNRAGTRGFRAPEVLLKCPDQTVAIDVWSAGVMLLSMLAHKFPVFNSTDDVESLMEIAAVFGRGAMERCALLHNRTIMTNVPTVDHPPDSLAALILRLNPHLYTPHQAQPTREEALAHITDVDAAFDLCGRLLRLDATTRITAAAALRHRFLANDEDDGPDEILDVTEGKCGHLHQITEDGTHQARFGDVIEDMRYGQGIPTSRDALCPEHEHWQQRSGVNPLGAAYGATLDDEYYEDAGFHVKDEHAGWDDVGPARTVI